MGFDLQKAFHKDTKKLLWLIGPVIATVVFFQCIELPDSNAVWAVFSSENSTLNPVILSNTSSSSVVNSSIAYEEKDGNLKNKSSPLVSEKPEFTPPLENGNSSFIDSGEGEKIALPMGQNGNSISPENPELTLISANGTSNGNNSYPEIRKEEIASSLNETSPSVVNTSIAYEEKDGNLKNKFSPVYGGVENHVSLEKPEFTPSLENTTSNGIDPRKEEDIVLLPLGQNGNSSSPKNPELTLLPNNGTSNGNTSYSNITMELKTSSEINGLRPPPLIQVPEEKPRSEMPRNKEVLTLSDMNELVIESHKSPDTMVPRWSWREDQELIYAKSEIENAPPLNNSELYAPLYHNASMFQRSYELMEQFLKVYIYKEGEKPIFHSPPLEGIYASEGWFMKLLEANRHFITKKPEEAHLFYLPFSSRALEETLYIPDSHSHKNLIQYLKNYLDMISAKYPFWNRTDGADHFLVACHDWAPVETKQYMANCIRALCNADVKEGFKFGKDVSLPETYVRKAKNPLRSVGGKSPSRRKTLAFFAGNMHGYLRPILLQHWGNKNDPDMEIFGQLPRSKGNRNYIDYMKNSKYCICPRGYEVNSPRVVEAIFYECVPVIISDNFVPPFLETLNWESFSVFISEKDIPNLKNILLSIPEKTYISMHMRVKKVQQHFLWHPKPVKYDLFHMILHSIWYNRVFQFRIT